MSKYELTPHQRTTMNRIRLALGKPESWNPKALENLALDLILGFGPGTKDKDRPSIMCTRAAILEDFSATFESNEVSEIVTSNPHCKEECRTRLKGAKASIEAVLLRLDA